jgi:hypothetical protein
MPIGLQELRRKSWQEVNAGNVAAAATVQCDLVNRAQIEGGLEARDLALLGYLYISLGDFKQALVAYEHCLKLDPDRAEASAQKAYVLLKLGRVDEVPAILVLALERDPRNGDLWSMLCEARLRAGDSSGAREAGLRALELRAQSGGGADFDPQQAPIPPLRFDVPERNVVAFSLFGGKPRYIEGALNNARLMPHIYPGWRCRFYLDDTVPQSAQEALLAHGADIVRMPTHATPFEGLFWRFLAADDPSVERYLIRDADSVINTQERCAVDDWLMSGRHFHVMRDSWSHTEPMLAGMWGGVRGALPPLAPMIPVFLAETARQVLVGRVIDQRFLRLKIWPIARKSVCQHDSIFGFDGARDFPPYGRRGPGSHVGQDDHAYRSWSGEGARGKTLQRTDVGIR